MTNNFSLVKSILISASLVLPSIAFAAGNASVDLDGSTASIQWLDVNSVRFNIPDSNDYLLSRDNKVYVVTNEDGQPMVMDIAGMAQMAMAFADEDSLNKMMPDAISNVKSTGKTETIGGIKGDVYTLTIQEKGGDKYDVEAVLSKDKTANELTAVYIKLMQTMLGVDNLQKTFEQLPKNKRGILRLDDEFKIISLSNKAPSNQDLELPAEPLSMQDLMQDLQKMMQGLEKQ